MPVTEKSYFRCASVTKLVTGIGLMRMMDDGLLDPDEDISAYLGYEAGNPRYPDTPITLRMLMSHTSGLNENSSYSRLSSKLSDMIALDKKGGGQFQRRPPRQPICLFQLRRGHHGRDHRIRHRAGRVFPSCWNTSSRRWGSTRPIPATQL